MNHNPAPNYEDIIPSEKIVRAIYRIRGKNVILDRDLAELYGVQTKVLKRAVRRNSDRFPADFMFLLDSKEVATLRCQFGASNTGRGGTRYPPMAFTEQGVAMLSGVLQSKRAVDVNIAIMRSFVKLRDMLTTHADLARKLEALELKYDEQFKLVFDAIRALMAPQVPEKPRIGFELREIALEYDD